MTLSNPPPTTVAPRLHVPAGPRLLDDPFTFAVERVPPGARVTVRAWCDDEAGVRWRSAAEFMADAGGRVDPEVVAPVGGSYGVVDPLGVIWSMTPDGAPTTGSMFALTTRPMTVHLEVELDGRAVAEGAVERRVLADGVKRTEVREAGLVATLFVPPGEGPFPAVVVVGGSEGGLRETPAGLLASRGFVTLALAYFSAEGLPRDLVRVPLEYFGAAFDWLLARPEVRPGKLGFTGGSRGGELSLLLGTMYPQIGAIVAIAPSAYVHGGLSREANPDGPPAPAWTRGGEPLPFVPSRRGDPAADDGGPIRLTPLFLAALEDRAAAAAATIPVEKIVAPTLLLAGEDDQMWPAAHFSRLVEARLRDKGHTAPFEVATYPGAGHLLSLPGVPATTTHAMHPVRSVVYAYGGEPVANRVARADAWARSLAFFRRWLSA